MSRKIMAFKSYSNVLFYFNFFISTNGLCTCITKIVIIFKKNKTVFVENKLCYEIFCAINRLAIEVLF